MTTFADLFKNGFDKIIKLSEVTLIGAAYSLACAFLIGLFIYFIYRRFYGGAVYNRNFNISLIMMSMLTCTIIMTISSNIVLSLGMVGALSIVRFRTAVKDPVDLVFLFWSIAAGIASGAKIYEVAAGASFFIGLVFIMLSFTRFKQDTYILVINFEERASAFVTDAIGKFHGRLRSRVVSKDGNNECTYEIKLKDSNTAFVGRLAEMPGVNNVTLVAYDGDFAL